MERSFVPVEANENNKETIWHIDVSKLGLERLLLLKKELAGTEMSISSDIIIEGIMYNRIGTSRVSYGLTSNTMRKEAKRNLKIKKKMMKYNKERINDDKY